MEKAAAASRRGPRTMPSPLAYDSEAMSRSKAMSSRRPRRNSRERRCLRDRASACVWS